MSYFAFIFKFLKENGIAGWHCSMLFILKAMGMAVESLGLGLLLPIGDYLINKARDNSETSGQLWTYISDFSNNFGISLTIYHVVSLFAVTLMLRQIIVMLHCRLDYYLFAEFAKNVRQRMVDLFIGMSTEKHDRVESGSFVNVITNEVKFSFPLVCVTDLFRSLGLLLVLTVVLVLTSPLLTILSLLSFLVVAFLFRGVSHSMSTASNAQIDANSDFSQQLIQRLKAFKQIKVDQSEEFESEKIGIVLQRQANAVRRVGFLTAITETTVEPLIFSTAIGVLGLVSIFYEIELALFGFFLIVIARMLPLFKQTFTGWQRWIRVKASLDTVTREIANMTEGQERAIGTRAITVDPIVSIRFEDVCYAYKSEKANNDSDYRNNKYRIVDNVNIELTRGQIVGLIGPSGSGKSTLVDLLIGLRIPDEGQILVNSKPLSGYLQSTYRSKVGSVSQVPTFFEGSIRENLTAGNGAVTDEEICHAASLANALGFISARADGLDTLLSEYGGGLSVGQRQRLDITRALLRDPDILVFDEPTSSVDPESAELIKKSLWNIRNEKNKIILVVTHNHELTRGYDQIIEMSNGKTQVYSKK